MTAPVAAPAAAMDRDTFARELLAWVNRRLLPPGIVVEVHTSLFANRLVDSIRILELIAWTERALGRRVPDASIRMDNFQSVARMAAVFCDAGPAASPEAAA